MTSYPIIINRGNLVANTKNTYQYNFSSNVDTSNLNIGLSSATLNYSWPNISVSKGNNTFQISHPTSGANVVLTLTIPDGGYNITDLNSYLEYYLITNGYYIQKSSTLDRTVYCEFRLNPVLYSVEFVSYAMPTALPGGYTTGSAITFPATPKGPQLIVTTVPFGTLIGYALGTFPSSVPTVDTSVESTLVPQVSSVQNVVITVDCINNEFATNSKVIHAISPSGVSYGGIITSIPPEVSFVPCQSGVRQSLIIQFLDQNGLPLNMLDSDITIKLLLKYRDDSRYLR